MYKIYKNKMNNFNCVMPWDKKLGIFAHSYQNV